MLRSRLPIALILWLLGGAAFAQDDDWITVKAGNVLSFEAPTDTRVLPTHDVDTLTGQYENNRFALELAYGRVSDLLYEPPRDSRLDVETTVIDGHKAEIFTGPGESGGGCVFETDLYMAFDSDVALIMSACANGYAGVVQLHRLYKSVRFTTPPT